MVRALTLALRVTFLQALTSMLLFFCAAKRAQILWALRSPFILILMAFTGFSFVFLSGRTALYSCGCVCVLVFFIFLAFDSYARAGGSKLTSRL
jgi:hypothetical protein